MRDPKMAPSWPACLEARAAFEAAKTDEEKATTLAAWRALQRVCMREVGIRA